MEEVAELQSLGEALEYNENIQEDGGIRFPAEDPLHQRPAEERALPLNTQTLCPFDSLLAAISHYLGGGLELLW